jgi:thiol-disulfide isomerase/thioredoxin
MPQLTQFCPSVRALLRARSLIAVLAVFAALLPLAASADIVGKPAADFALRSMKGPSVRLSEHLGEVVVINFWATWCGPCRQEMPLLDELYGKYQLAGLILLSVNIDENAEPAIEMAQTLKVSYPVLFDARKEVSRAYEVSAMPVTVLVDRAGVVRYVSEGYKPGYEKRYTEKLRELLNE